MSHTRAVTTDVVPILRVADAAAAARWYARLGFTVEFEHRFETHLPAYVGIRREGSQLHLSEHDGDARPGTLVYIWVDDVDAIATEFDVAVDEPPWGREVYLIDPDHNRLRVAEPVGRSGTVDVLTALERAMWDASTRGDRSWMDAHLTEDFTEFGFSGRAYDRADILDTPVGTIDATLADMEVRPVGRDAALVTYRSQQPRGAANRASVWRRADGRWRMAFHQGTPTG
jgi:predicted enzyme related to lactoylglutathione lyase